MNVTVIAAAVLNTNVMLIKTRQDIKKAYERMIFVDDGGCEGKTEGGWTVTFQSPPQWWDPPSARHGDGTTFSFADGHAEYHKWLESSTLDCAKQGTSRLHNNPCDANQGHSLGTDCCMGFSYSSSVKSLVRGWTLCS